MVDVVMIRTFEQAIIERFAAHSRVPVINGLTNEYHPCQILADIYTYVEHRGSIAGRTVAWIGDSNNVCNTWLQAAAIFDFTRARLDAARLRDRRAARGAHGRARTSQSFADPHGGVPRRRPRHHRRLDQHGLRGGERRAQARFRAMAESTPT